MNTNGMFQRDMNTDGRNTYFRPKTTDFRPKTTDVRPKTECLRGAGGTLARSLPRPLQRRGGPALRDALPAKNGERGAGFVEENCIWEINGGSGQKGCFRLILC